MSNDIHGEKEWEDIGTKSGKMNPICDSQLCRKVPQFLAVAAIIACEKCLADDQTAYAGKFHQGFKEDMLSLPRTNPAKQADNGKITLHSSMPRPGWQR